MGQLLLWWCLIEVMGLVGLPLTFRVFSARADYGFPFAKLATLLLVSWAAWMLGHLGLFSYQASLWTTILIYIAICAYLFVQAREPMMAWLRGGGWRAILLHDGLWTAGFLFFAWQRSLGPEIIGAEKFMDFAFYNTLARVDAMPPQDMWMSGEIFNYYYFGYLVLANLCRLMPIPPYLSYNFCVATLGGLAFSLPVAVGLMLTRSLAFGILSGVMSVLIGNLDGLLQFLEKGGLTKFDYWRSTRIVGGDSTINEFPYFTVIHGDVHPHFIVLPVAVMLWALLSDPDRRTPVSGSTWDRLRHYGPIAFVLASSVVISPWELPVSAMMVFLLLQREAPLRPLLAWPRIQAGIATAVLLVLAYILYLPFYLQFAAPQGGVGFKFAKSSLLEFLTVFGALLAPPALFLLHEVTQTSMLALRREVLHALGALVVLALLVAGIAGGGSINLVFILLLAMIAGALVAAYRIEDLEQRTVSLLVLGALAALFACELVYIRDPYGDRLYRMNTVFKLYFQAWILLVLAGPWCWQQLMKRPSVTPLLRNVATVALSFLLIASFAYPAGITMTRLSNRGVPRTLDGNEYMRREHPGDYAAIEWLRANVTGLPVVLEASGDPYSYYARFSSNVGIPTVMGWANHEGLWRNHEAPVAKRRADVTRMYSARSLEEVTPLLDEYKVKYVVVGELERKDYPADGLAKFSPLKVAFQSGNVIIYER